MMTAVSSREGISDEEISSIADFESSTLFDETDRLVLRYATQMTETPVEIQDDFFEQLKKCFSEKQLVELTASIAFENFRARLDHAFGIESSGFAEGAECEIPTS